MDCCGARVGKIISGLNSRWFSKCMTTTDVLQFSIPASREMLRQLPIVMWLQVAVIIIAVLFVLWQLYEVVHKHSSKSGRLHSSSAQGTRHMEQHVQPSAHM